MSRIIEVRDLSKRYYLYHELQSAYSTLIETLSNGAKRLFDRARYSFRKEALPPLKSCEEFWALKDVNVQVEQGDRIGIIGRNGAGKSTFLKILSRIVEPTSGSLRIQGRVASLLEVGTGFHQELTGRENIFLNGAILGMSQREIQKKFDEIVAFSEIEQFLDTPVKRYSSGMYTRLGFAVAAHLDPDILIIDEVLAVGDMQFQNKCFKKLNELGNSIQTVLFVTHNVQAISNLCNKGLLFENGRIKLQGSVDECVNEYLRTYRALSLTWEGDLGDDDLRINKANLTPTNNEYFTGQEKVLLSIEYEVVNPAKDFVLGFCVHNSKGHLLARSFVGDEAAVFDTFCVQGKRRLQFTFSAEHFRDDDYVIYVNYGRLGRGTAVQDQIALKFTVFTPHKTMYSMRNVAMEGIFLGNEWVQN